MKTKLVSTFLFLIVACSSFAQDTIYKTNGSRIIARVIEINAATIKYKFVNNGTELVAESNKSEIAYIVYSGGMKEIYNPMKETQVHTPLYKSTEISTSKTVATEEESDGSKTAGMKNIIAVNCFEIVFTNFSASYERIFKKGHLSIKVPVSIGLGGRPNQENYTSRFGTTQFLQNRLYSGGLEFNAYPYGQTRSTFYVGLSFVAGSFTYYKETYNNSGTPYYPYYTSTKYIGSHYAGMLHLGGYLGLSENLLLGAKIGAGYKREETIEMDYTLPKLQCDLNLAYRF